MAGFTTKAVLLAALAAAAPSWADGPLVRREPFAKAHVTMMARAEAKGASAKMADVDVWAEGGRLRALVRGEGEFWVDGLNSSPLLIKQGKVAEPHKRTLEQGLSLALGAAPDLGNSKNDRVAGHPCKVVTQQIEDVTLTRCLWRGLPLSIELSGKGFSFNAAATLVEEGRVTVADLQPPPGAPPAARGLSAGR